MCDDTTGRAGRGEDSIYCDICEEYDKPSGPFCPDCWDGHPWIIIYGTS